MAKAPGRAKDFDGAGNVWFKVFELGPQFSGSGPPTYPVTSE